MRSRGPLLAALLATAVVASGCAFLDGEVEVTTTRRVIEESGTDAAPLTAPSKGVPTTRSTSGTPAGAAAGGREGPSATDPASAKESGGADGGELVLGTIQPLNGAERQLGEPLLRTTQAWVADVNARGGIDGRQVVLHVEQACLNCQDDALAATRRLVEERGVFAIVNTYMLTFAMSSAADYLEAKGVPLIGGNADSMTTLALTPNAFFLTSRNFAMPQAWARFLADVFEAEGRTLDIGVTHLEAAEGKARADRFTQEWERLGGRVVTTESVRAEEDAVTNMDSMVIRMRAAGAQGVFAANNILLVFGEQAAERQGWDVPWGAHSAWGKAVPDNCGDACDGDYTSSLGYLHPSADTPAMRRYLEAMERSYPAATHDSQTLMGWAHGVVLEEVVGRLGGELTRPALIAGFEGLDDLDVGLTVAPIDTGPDDHMGIPADQFLQLRGTEWVPVGQPIAGG